MDWKGGTNDELLGLVKLQAELIDAMHACSAELDSGVLLQMVVDSARTLTNAEFVIFMSDEDDEEQVLSIADLEEPHCVSSDEHAYSSDKIISYMTVPVIRKQKIFGALYFGHNEPDKFSKRHKRAMTMLAAQASIALDNALLYKTAQEAIAVREDFLSIAAHEIRTPLTPLTLQLQMLEMTLHKVKLSKRSRELRGAALDMSLKQVKRLTIMVEELLDVSRIRVGKLTLEPTCADLVGLARDVIDRYRIQAEVSGCPLTFTSRGDLNVEVDQFRVQQVLTNILLNALKYAPGSVINVNCYESDCFAYITFEDHGPGIAVEDQERIFNRFERANAQLKRGGLGLGLYLGREIIEAHGGKIQVTSDIGQGSVFAVSIPLTKSNKGDRHGKVDIDCR